MKLKRTPITAIGAVVALVFIAAALVVGIDFAPRGADTSVTPLISTVLGFVGIAIPALLAAYKAESNHQDLRNGVLVNKVKQALGEYSNDVATPALTLGTTPIVTRKVGDPNGGPHV